MAQSTDTPVSVVLVDDSRELRQLVRRRLERTGQFDVVAEGGDGDEAITLVIRHQPELLLLDTSMPTCDGIQALPAIAAVSPDTRVVMFTGFDAEGLAERARELGAVDFVEKSLPLEQLPDRLLMAVHRAAEDHAPSSARLSVVRDDSHAMLADEQALVSEHVAQFQELFEQAAIGMATLTVTGTVVRANRALAELMSCRPSDLVGVDYGRLTGGGGDELDQALEDLTASNRNLVTLEHPLPSAAGIAQRVARLTLAPIRDSRGQALYVFAQVQDISDLRAAEMERRATERGFRLLVEAVPDYAIFMLDREGTVVSWNLGAQRIKGYAAHEIIGRSFRVFYSPEDQTAGIPEYNLAHALQDGRFVQEGWRIRKDGSRFWANVVISTVHDESGTHLGFAKVTRDLTEQREHEEELQEAVNQQSHFLSVTAHELRTPTAVIEGSAAALQGDDYDAETREVLFSNISGSAQRLRRLASDLATASQVQRGTLRYQWEDVPLGSLLQRAVAHAHSAGHDITEAEQPPASLTMRADPVRLAQAVDNLLDNAVRHGEPPVVLRCTDDGEVLRIIVEDAGRGVPSALAPHLFDRFAMGPRGGTGLGLYLVREIVRAHGGEIEHIPPSQGQANAFVMTFPSATHVRPAAVSK